VKWAVCIITTNAAPPNTHPMRRHRIDCLQKNRRLRVVVRRRPDLCATRHFDESSKEAPAHMLLPSSRTFGFFVGTIDQEPPGTLMPTPTCIRSEARKINPPSTCPRRVALSVLSFIARIDSAHLSTLSLYVILTASPSRWTSILQIESYQWVLHVYIPRYLESWVSTEGGIRVSY